MSSNELPKIRNNSAIILSSQIISLALNIISISFAARYLGVEEFGRFNYLLAIVGIGAKILDFGFNPIIFRELSLQQNVGKYLGSVLVFRVVIILIIVSMFSLIGYFLNLGSLEIVLIAMLAFNILFSNKFTNVRELLTIPFKVDLKMHIPMLLIILDNILLLFFILMMPFFGGGIIYFIFIYTIANLPGMVLLSFFIYKKYNFKVEFDSNEITYLFKESLPLMGFIVFAVIYAQIDILLLENMSGSTSVGIYSTAIRLITPLKLIPNVVVITLFSLIVKNIDNSDYNERIVRFVTKLFFLFSISFSAFMFISSEEIILIVFGDKYVEAALPLRILSIGLFFDFFSFFILDLFTAYSKQKYNFQFILIVTSIVLITNIVLIPFYDFVGSSMSRIVSGSFGFLFLLFILKRKIKINISFITIRLLIAVSFFLISIYIFSNLYPIINVLINSILFIILTFSLKVFTQNEMKIILQLINNRKIASIIYKYYEIEE